MKSINQVINALRCTSTPRPKYGCTDCPYRRLEKVEENIPIKEDVIIDGEKYWEICKVEQIAIDAADLLEKIKQNIEADIRILSRWENQAEEKAKAEKEQARKTYYDGKSAGFYEALALVKNTREKINTDASDFNIGKLM